MAVIGITVAVIFAILVIQKLPKQQNQTALSGQIGEPTSLE